MIAISEGAIFGLIGSVATPTVLFLMWKFSKPHTEKVADSNALSAAVTAIGEAAVNVVGASTSVSNLVQELLRPLREEIASLRVEHAAELARVRAEFRDGEQLCAHRVDVLADHVNMLRRRMRASGLDPGDPPPLDGFFFD